MKNIPTNLSNLKSKVDKLDDNKLVPVPVDLSKPSNVLKNDVVKKTEYNELVKKVNNISTSDISNLVRKTDYNTKIIKIENKIITTREFNELASETFAPRLAQENLASKKGIANLVKWVDFDDNLKN